MLVVALCSGTTPVAQASDWQPGALEPGAEEAQGIHGRLGLQSLWVSEKVVVGPTMRIGQGMFFGRLETHLMWTTDTPAEFDRPFLGSQYGLYFEVLPLRHRYVELSVAAGADIFHLWGLHGNEVQASFSVKAGTRIRLTRQLGLNLEMRAYPVTSRGLELGTDRQGQEQPPLLFGTALEWRSK